MIAYKSLINSVLSSAGKMIKATITGPAGQIIESMCIYGQYGFSSRPKANAEAVVLNAGSRPIIIATQDRRYAIELSDGDVAMHTSTGQYIKLKSAGGIEIKSGSPVTVIADHINLGDSLGVLKLIDERLIAAYNLHVHSGGTIAGSTGVPAALLGDTGIPCTTTKTQAK
jgi:phage gp45-like